MVGCLAKFNDIFTSTVPTINNFSNHALRINCLTLFVQLKIQNNILFLYTTVNRVFKQECQIAGAKTSGLTRRYRQYAQDMGNAKRRCRIKSVGDRSSKSRMLTIGGKKVMVAGKKLSRPARPQFGPFGVCMTMQIGPYQAIIIPGIGVIMIAGFIHAVHKPALAAIHGLQF